MKIIFAPDSYKGTMRSPRICEVLQAAFKAELPEAELLSLPMADGGEGSAEALLAAGWGEPRQATVQNPLGRRLQARFAYNAQQGLAMLDMASASGIELLETHELNPMLASSRGTGELLLAAKKLGLKEIILGIGGSATVDGGAGMAQALGCKLLDRQGRELPPGAKSLHALATIETEAMQEDWKGVKVSVASDVNNPLCGPRGAVAMFARQKGADEEMLPKLEAGLQNWAAVLQKAGLISDAVQPGDGAAGGLGLALRALLKAETRSGAQLLAEMLELRRHLAGASLIITGEGHTDEQTLHGKLPAVLADLAAEQGLPCILLSGAVKGDQALLRQKFQAIYATLSDLAPLPTVLANAEKDLYDRARAIAATLRMGGGGGH
ncbi:MAG: glycerate kinase [Lentisphaeria bacterium]|nr:glycerate kinase [Lentisphaeria bacterium]